MRLILVLFFQIVLFFSVHLYSAASGAQEKPSTEIDRIFVIVNGDVITKGEFIDDMEALKRQVKSTKRRLPPDKMLGKQVLERLMMKRIQLQRAGQLGIRVSEKTVDRAMESIAKRNRLNVSQLRQALARDGVKYEDFRNDVRDQIVIRRLVEREVNDRITVTDSEVNNFLLGIEKRGGLDEEYNVSHILIVIPESATPAAIQEARKQAVEAYTKIRQGADFEQIALQYSQGREALDGGSLGWKKLGQLPAAFVSALKKVRPGEVAKILRGPNGFHIVKLNAKRGGGAQTVVQTHARHILIRPSEILSRDYAVRRLEQTRERILSGEDFATLAKAHSGDYASSIKGGDLGWISPGAMVSQFEKAMDALKPGEISQPVHTRYGVHIIQVLERRRQDVSKEREQADARRQIRERKASERHEQWLRQLRDEAYVEYRLTED